MKTKNKLTLLFLAFLLCNTVIKSQVDSSNNKIPFDGIDLTWQNGSDRRDSSVFKIKYFKLL